MATDETTREVVLEDPSLLSLYARAARSTSVPTAPLPTRAVVRRGIAVDGTHVGDYATVCGFRRGGGLPSPYLHLLTFPSSLHLMAADDFPFAVLGMVHLRQHIVVHRQLRVGAIVDVAVTVDGRRPHRRGEQFDVHAVVRPHDRDEVVWTGRSTYLHRSSAQLGEGGDDAAGDDRHPTDDVDVAGLPATSTWHVASDIGRRYAAVSGDRNPIHLAAITARPFGFRTAIAHGMWTLGRAVAGCEGLMGPTATIDVSFGTALPLPSSVTYATRRRGDDLLVGVRPDDERGRPHLTGVITPR